MINGWPAILLAIVAIPAALVAALLTKAGILKSSPNDMSAEVVAGYIRNFIEGTGSDWDWDDFENMTLNDPVLEAIRNEACRAAPPNADDAKLKDCVARADALADQARVQALTHHVG